MIEAIRNWFFVRCTQYHADEIKTLRGAIKWFVLSHWFDFKMDVRDRRERFGAWREWASAQLTGGPRCRECGSRENLVECFYRPRDGKPDEYLCRNHVEDSGFCWGCGLFWGGVESFDFSRTGLCENCEIEFDDDWDEDDYDYEYDDYNYGLGYEDND